MPCVSMALRHWVLLCSAMQGSITDRRCCAKRKAPPPCGGVQFGSQRGDNEIIQECGPHHHAWCGGLPDSVRAACAPAIVPPRRPRRASRLRSNRDLLPRWSMSSLAARKMSGSEITRSLLAIRSSLVSPPAGARRATTSGLLADAEGYASSASSAFAQGHRPYTNRPKF